MVFLKRSDNSIACVIGINYRNTDGELNGCINDADKIKDFLQNHLGYKNQDIYYLTDDSECKPTYHNILNTLQEMLNKIKNEKIEHVWLSYSGHGSYIKDYNKDEKISLSDLDGKDECIIPLDYNENGFITDDMLYQLFVKELPTYVTMVSLIDACHSGTMLDLPYIYRSDNDKIEENTSIENIDNLAKIIKISGCNDGQTSADAFISNQYQGAMTHSFFKTLELYNYNISCKHLIKQMVRYLSDNEYTQIPTISCTNINYLDELLMGDTLENWNTIVKLNGDNWCNQETSWNIYSYTQSKYIYDKNKMFDMENETLELNLYIEPGDYELCLFDMYGDGGVHGEICNKKNQTICNIEFNSGNSEKYKFNILPKIDSIDIVKKVKFIIEGDIYSVFESSWNIMDSNDKYIFPSNQGFSITSKTQTKIIELKPGRYNVCLFDKWGDGGIKGEILDNNSDKQYLTFNWIRQNWSVVNGSYKTYSFIVN